MTHADAFLQEILAHPDDDAPRLIFADWLEEQGDAGSVSRAELIRVQCALAGAELPPRQRAEMDRRQQQILDTWGSLWVGPIRRLAQRWEFHRGFIDEVAVWANAFLQRSRPLFRRAPIQHLSLWPSAYTHDLPFLSSTLNVAALADNKHLRRLCSLNLKENQLESRHLRALLVSEHLTSLTALDLSYNRIGDSGIRALADSLLLGRLKHLNLRGNDIGANGVRALTHALEELARSPSGLRLQHLELSQHNLNSAGQRVIADSPLLRRLVRC